MVSRETATWGELAPILPRLRVYATALSGCRDAAEDLLQSTIERALRGNQNHAPLSEDQIYKSMWQIWKRARQDERRRQRSERREADDMVVDGRLEVEAQDSLRVARTRISQLSSGQRQVVELVIRDGKSYRETADLLGIAMGAVMSRLARARASLIGPE